MQRLLFVFQITTSARGWTLEDNLFIFALDASTLSWIQFNDNSAAKTHIRMQFSSKRGVQLDPKTEVVLTLYLISLDYVRLIER